MNVKWDISQKLDGTTYRQIEVSESPDWELFNELAAILEKGIKGHWTAKLDGPNQRYWDLEAHSGKITLHLERYLGITTYPSEGEMVALESVALLEDAYLALSKHNPS